MFSLSRLSILQLAYTVTSLTGSLVAVSLSRQLQSAPADQRVFNRKVAPAVANHTSC